MTSSIVGRVFGVFGKVFGVDLDEIDCASKLFYHNLADEPSDPDFLELVHQLKKEFDEESSVEIMLEEIRKFSTVGQVIDYISEIHTDVEKKLNMSEARDEQLDRIEKSVKVLKTHIKILSKNMHSAVRELKASLRDIQREIDKI